MEKTIDIRSIVSSKLGTKAKYVPSFTIKWLEKIIHQDEVNSFLFDSRDLVGVDWLNACVVYLQADIKIIGEENLPLHNNGKYYTFVSNHPLGGIDGVALGAVLGKHYGNDFRYLVNDLLMNLPGLAPLCIPINKTGKQSREFPQMVEKGFAGNNHILMFPAGLCSRKQRGQIRDLQWKKTFITKSIETQRDIVPIHFNGRNSERFYAIANICKRLGLKVNLAMLFLVDEMYRNVGKTFEVRIGKPIPYEYFDKSKSATQWAEEVKTLVYNLKQD